MNVATTKSKMTRLYCYVDESGQDTRGGVFIVSVVIADEEREEIIQLCEKMERKVGKGRVKWIKTDYTKRLEFIRLILREENFKGSLFFADFRNSRDYFSLTVQTIARAINARVQESYKATVFIDGLPRAQERRVGGELRRMRIQVRKVRGVGRDENDALIRLADALWIRARGD